MKIREHLFLMNFLDGVKQNIKKVISGVTIELPLPNNLSKEDSSIFEKYQVYTTSDVYIIELIKVNLSEGGILLKGLKILEQTRYSLVDLKNLSHIHKRFTYLLKTYIRRRKVLKQIFVFVIDKYSFNYYHWIIEVLPRLLVSVELYNEVSIALPSEYKSKNFVRESLLLFPLKNVVYFDTNFEYLHFHRLIICTQFAKSTFNNPVYIKKIVNHIKSNINKSSLCSDYHIVYVSRRHATKRKVLNEIRLIQKLEQHDVKVLFFEELSFAEYRP